MPIQPNAFTAQTNPFFVSYEPFKFGSEQKELVMPFDMVSINVMQGDTFIDYTVGAENTYTIPLRIKNISANKDLQVTVTVSCQTALFKINGKLYQDFKVVKSEEEVLFEVSLNKEELNNKNGTFDSDITVSVSHNSLDTLAFTTTNISVLEQTFLPETTVIT